MTIISRLSLIFTFMIAAALSGFFYGRSFEHTKTLSQAVVAFQNREKINDETFALSPFHLCIALGGLSDECSTLLHGMDKTSRY
ncbi:hypothetical protein [Bartonella sp. A05]|uniref:hypothetical protein n=1 Tax=Bartonella sp. A05 TaxID=2967261 RepID=UPI0022A9D833|nr:hypothetical protein [Bartonella sp. A05]MCZ2203726.1 hypothetical protein [Bartonella sp. A05]